MNNERRTLDFRRRVTKAPEALQWAGAPLLLFAACDSAYVAHAIALVRSLDAFAPGHHFLLHLINPTPAVVDRIEALRSSLTGLHLHISSEKVRVPNANSKLAYYASARFLLMAELLRDENAVPMLALDADAIAVGPLTHDFTDKPEAEICLRRRDLQGAVEPHLQVAAGAVYVRPTPATQQFFDAMASDLIAQFSSGEAKWMIDQVLLGTHVNAATGDAQIRNLKTKFADWGLHDDSIFWMGKGSRKYIDVRYLVLREAFDEDPERRESARALHARFEALVPLYKQGIVGQRARHIFALQRKTRVAIFLPRLDLPWKISGMRAHGAAPALSEDVIELRLWWKRFTMELARMLTQHDAEPRLIEIPAWEITPERVDGEDVDFAFIPHRCDLDFPATRTPRNFYMQEYLRSAFVVDPRGWSAGSSVYPVAAETLPPAVLGAWDHYRKLFLEGNLPSKFNQPARQSRSSLEAAGLLPAGEYAFFPLQIPHDLSIRYFSEVELSKAIAAAAGLARSKGLTLVLKEHPANRASMSEYRQRFSGPGFVWSEANVHDLLLHAEGVITINSGVGFEGLLAGVPIVCLGRSEYDSVVWQADLSTMASAWEQAVAEPENERMLRYGRFVDWFLARHAVDLARPQTGRFVLDRVVRGIMGEVAIARRPLE